VARSQQIPLWKWSRDRPIKVTIFHPVSTLREGGALCDGNANDQFEILNRFLIENVSVDDHCSNQRPALVPLPDVSLGAFLQRR
jgi:hypothetical protein